MIYICQITFATIILLILVMMKCVIVKSSKINIKNLFSIFKKIPPIIS